MENEALESYKVLLAWLRNETELDAFSGATKVRLVSVLQKLNNARRL